MPFTWMEFVILVLASFRLTRLLVYDGIMEWLRRPFHRYIEEENEDGEIETYIEVKGTGLRKFLGELLSCHWCTGMWVSAGILICFFYLPWIMPLYILLAVSGAAALLFEIFPTE